jgi:hypothetical protein
LSADLLRHLRDSGSTPAELDAVWASLPAVQAAEILGRYRGSAIPTGHPLEKALVRAQWWGKEFRSVNDVSPLLCTDEAGELFSNVELGNGEASLWNVEFRGEVTATMVYDGQPVFDHFKSADGLLMGIMNGKSPHILHDGAPFYFLLEPSL